MNYDAMRVAGLGSVLLLVIAIERIAPISPVLTPWRTNVGLWLIDTVVMRLACAACGLTIAAWAESRGFGAMRWFAMPVALAVALSIVALDGVSYLWHRANHTVAWLWRWHEVHHADRAFQVTTALRFHPGELLLALPARLAAIALLGLPVAGVLAFELCFGAMNLFVHGNFTLPRVVDRVVSRCFITPGMHRLHHARSATHLNTNFGTIFSVFDRGLRTLNREILDPPIETGIPDVEGDRQMSLRQALLSPFRRRSARP